MIYITVILLSGSARHGKDTVGQILKNKLGDRVFVVAFAEYLKFMCQKYFGWDGNKDEKGRHILQFIGTNLIRKNNPDMWVNVVNELIWGLRTEYDYFIITDCRFPNECTVLQDNGYNVISVKIERPNFDNGLTEDQKVHPSENALNDWIFDYTIINDGTLEDLERKVEQFIKTEEI